MKKFSLSLGLGFIINNVVATMIAMFILNPLLNPMFNGAIRTQEGWWIRDVFTLNRIFSTNIIDGYCIYL